jgi:hypothetical protein
MTSTRAELQDRALADTKLIFQIIEELQKPSEKSKLAIFENSLRFTFQELARTLHDLNELSTDPTLIAKSSFLTPAPSTINVSDLQPKLLELQKYLLAGLL